MAAPSEVRKLSKDFPKGHIKPFEPGIDEPPGKISYPQDVLTTAFINPQIDTGDALVGNEDFEKLYNAVCKTSGLYPKNSVLTSQDAAGQVDAVIMHQKAVNHEGSDVHVRQVTLFDDKSAWVIGDGIKSFVQLEENGEYLHIGNYIREVSGMTLDRLLENYQRKHPAVV